MTLVVSVACGLEPNGRAGDGMNPIRKTEKILDQMSLLEKEWARECEPTRERELASQMRMLCELLYNYRLRASIESVTNYDYKGANLERPH